MSFQVIREPRPRSKGSRKTEIFTIELENVSARGAAKPRRALDQGLQHGLQIESRAADDFEGVGGRGLLLQRFAQLVEQTRILDSDDGLGGEVLDQFDLFVGERTDLLAKDGDSTDQFTLLEHRYKEVGSRARAFHKSHEAR